MSRVAVGSLTGVFGIRGELKCRTTDAQAQPPAARTTYSLIRDGLERSLVCTAARRHHERLLLTFEGIDTPEAARALVGGDLYAERVEVPLGPNEYLDADLIGLRLVDESGTELAHVIGVEHYPAQDCLVVEPGRALVPLVKAFIKRIDIAAGYIVTALPAGLLET
ncbi:MAG: ribosome maturation factor RimM [Candidatus Eremiobacteraeota bacterium]|nr:ribosome maturation factor RimM [Candidatus Eremiobacteraeota bacterium]